MKKHIKNEWTRTVIFLTWYRHFQMYKMVDKTWFYSAKPLTVLTVSSTSVIFTMLRELNRHNKYKTGERSKRPIDIKVYNAMICSG